MHAPNVSNALATFTLGVIPNITGFAILIRKDDQRHFHWPELWQFLHV